MTFFPPRWILPAPADVEPGGWADYAALPAPTRKAAPLRTATDGLVVESEQVRLTVSAVDIYAEHVTFEVRCVLKEIRGGEALRDLLDAIREETPGASPPEDGLLVGLELHDGTTLRTYPVGPEDGRLRLQRRGGRAWGDGNEAAVVRQDLELQGVPDRPFRVVCSFAAVGVTEASVVVDLAR